LQTIWTCSFRREDFKVSDKTQNIH
jgi:hypothetical protein